MSEPAIGPPPAWQQFGAMKDESHVGEGRFPADRLRAYRVAVELQDRVQPWLPRMRRLKADLADHLERAVDSIVLNLAEGATEFSVGEKRRFYRIALRSAGEAAAALGFFARRLDGLQLELDLVDSLIAMITGLCRMNRKPTLDSPPPTPT